jgi:hypothetical protein
MPRRGKAPGLKRGRHNLPYWIATQVARDTMDFPDKCIPLPSDADEEMLAELCQTHTARLNAWIDARRGGDPEEPRTVTRYDGSMFTACRVYQEHPRSRFHTVKANTRKSYTDSLKIIEAEVGRRQIRRLNVLDLQHWYEVWREPAYPGGPERIDRAHDAITMVKMVLRFNAALRRPECKQLIDDLRNAGSLVNFEKGGARQEEMTFAYASAFVRKAIELGAKGIIPLERARSLAIGVSAQFDLLLRQKDIIGERPKTAADLETAQRRGATTIACGGQVWAGYFTWEAIAGWRWRTKTSKSKYRTAANFDLTIYSLLFPLLEAVPHDQRTGAIVTGEHGFPVQERSYRKWFRAIARAADIPDAVWNMDTRAGGATEAEEAGADFDAIRNLLTHSEKQEATTVRYLRRRDKSRVAVQEVRNAARASDEGKS